MGLGSVANIMDKNVLAIILAGGAGERLLPLTQYRAKPSVPFGGKYRIIDFTLSNCLHSGLRRILVLTQYKSHSLHKHFRDGWSVFNPELQEYITPVPSMDLYQEDWPIRSYQSQTPPARAVPGASGTEGVFINSMLSGGTVISGGNVDHSTLFQNVFIGDQALVTNSVIFGQVKIGRKAKLDKCIVDKHVTIPDGVVIGFDPVKDSERFTVTKNGIVVIPQDFCF